MSVSGIYILKITKDQEFVDSSGVHISSTLQSVLLHSGLRIIRTLVWKGQKILQPHNEPS